MNYKKAFRSANKALAISLFKKKIPFSVLLLLTNKCTRDCDYCDFKSRKTKEMTTVQIKKLIDELFLNGCERIGFSGGEPFLRKDLKEILSYAKNKGIFTTIDSNGDLVPQKKEILDYIDLYVASLDGINQDKIRGKDSFNNQLKAIKLAREKGVQVTSCSVLTKSATSKRNIDFLAYLAKKNDFNLFFTVPMNLPNGTSGDTSSFFASDEKYDEILRYIIEKRDEFPILNSKSHLLFLLNRKNFKKTFGLNGKGFSCYAGIGHADIDTNGDVFPCFPFIGSSGAKNFNDVGFMEAFRYSRNLCKVCKDCTLGAKVEMNLLFSLKKEALMNYFFKTDFLK